MINTPLIGSIFSRMLFLFFLLSLSHYAFSQEYIDIEFVDFEISDTVTAGGTLTLTGKLRNNGNIPIEPQLEMLMQVLPTGSGYPTFNSDIENNFNNDMILPDETQDFERQILVDDVIGEGGNNVIVVIWPRTQQEDSNFENNVFQAQINVETLDPAIQAKKLDTDPVVITGERLAESLVIGMPVDEVVGFKYDNGWQQIPIQIDELDVKDILTPYGPYRSDVAPFSSNPSARSLLFYTDENTYIGADTEPNFDTNDELVFMYKDAGIKSTATNYPIGVIEGTATELYVTSIFPDTDKYIYLFQQDGTLQQDAGIRYVDYEFALEFNDTYPDDFNFLDDDTEEDSEVKTAFYKWEFSKTWTSKYLKIYGDDLDETDILKRHETHTKDCEVTEDDFSEEVKCFIVNKSGPIRAIRSYMGATSENPYMQRTHFFYEKRQDIYTDIRVKENIDYYFDVFNFDNDIDDTSYISNMDVSTASIDGEDNDPISPSLYNTTPLKWELMDSPHGSILNVHALITNQDSLVPMGYWNDNDDENTCRGDDVYGSSGLQLQLDSLCTDPFDCPENYVQHRRCMFFGASGVSVEDASNSAKWVHQPLSVEWSFYDLCYELPQISVYLEGALTSTTQMKTALNYLSLLPAQHPYFEYPWSYPSTEGEQFIQPYEASVVDWVLVSFRTSAEATSEIAKTAALLHNDGRIEFLNDCLIDRLDGSNFYIAIEHRNHVGIMTPTAVAIINGTLEYDFRSQNSYSANNTRFGQKQIAPNQWAMYAGEGVQTNLGNDINGDDKAHWSNNSGFFNVYFSSDYNMDGDVNGGDKILWTQNNGISGALPK